MGQSLVEREFIKHGFNLFKPELENGKVDLIVEKNNQYFKIQIKTVQTRNNSKLIPVRKISHNMGEYKIKTYSKEDIDYFVGADVDTEDVYILPIEFSSTYATSISVSKCEIYKNNFNLDKELVSGNANNGGDDNVETLTGNDVGTN